MSERNQRRGQKVRKNTNVCQFIAKLTQMMKSHPQNVMWSDDGTIIRFRDLEVILNQVVPKYFRHHNMLSFVRQVSIQQLSQIQSSDENQMKFKNCIFYRGNEKNFNLISRRNKTRDQLISTFQKIYAKTLQLMENDVVMPEKIKQLIKTAMEYHIIVLKNLKRIKVSVQELVQQNKSARGRDIKNSHRKLKQWHLPLLTKLIEEGKCIESFIKDQLWRDIKCSKTTELLHASFPSQTILLDEPRTIKDVQINRVFLQSDYSIMNFKSECSLDKNLKEENFDKNEEISLQQDLKDQDCKQI